MEISERNLYLSDWYSLIRLANSLGIYYPFVMETEPRRLSLVIAVKKKMDKDRLIYIQLKNKQF